VSELHRVGGRGAELESEQVRPWGSLVVLDEGQGYKIKRVVVLPGQSVSLQMHHHRSEHWVVVAGTARVLCDGVEQFVCTNQSAYVPRCTAHRLENPGTIPLVLIEVQNGEYLGEDDIVRLEEGH